MGKQPGNDQLRRPMEDQVLAKAAQLDPADDSAQTRQLRETAASIREHRSSPPRAPEGK